jgi:DNA segregation ATPase FtsK/SpoIIIE-like protein
MNIFFHEKNKIIAYASFFIYLSAIIFLSIALFSYNPTDSSWFYVANDPAAITNQGGFLGAQIAAILFYFWGGATYLLLLPLLFLGVLCFFNQSIKTEWERVCALFFLVFISAIASATYVIDCSWSPCPGGMIGLIGAEKLVYYFDPLGRLLFLYLALCASLILVFRWSFISVVQGGIALVNALYVFIKKYHVVSRIAHGVGACLYIICVKIPVSCGRFVLSLCDGTAFNGTNLLHPHDDSDNEVDCEFFAQAQPAENVERVEIQSVQCDYLVLELTHFSPNRTELINYQLLSLPKKHTKQVRDAVEAYINLMKADVPQPKKPALSMTTRKSELYALPHMNIFVAEKEKGQDLAVEKELQSRAHILEDKLKRFGVNGNVTAIKCGPVVTLFEYQPDADTKLSKIIVLEDDLAMALQAMSIRIIAPIPGRSVVGFEVANATRQDVLFSQVITTPTYAQFSGNLPLILGKGTIGEVVVVDLARMPHLLIAGSTGSGKSVAMNAILISLLCKLSPDELKLILIDPKRLEFASFTDIPHLLFPIVTSPAHAAPVLRWVVQEMEERYEKMAQCGARNITDYNEKILRYIFEDKNTQGERSGEEAHKVLPFIVVMIDELADLMITAGRDIEDLITRITQMARAAGIHMIVATQRPSVDVITGLIKANFPSRISFRVASRIDSRTILDTMGADRLLGRGDMLFLDAATSQLRRVHGAYVSDKEIEQVADHIRKQRKVEYLDLHKITATHTQDLLGSDDALYKDVQEFLGEIDEISISLLQRKFRIGYNRSARIIDMLESQGLIMPQDGGKTRKVIR